MARARRRSYSPEFKAEAVRLVRTSSAPLTAIARDLGVTAWSLRMWVKAASGPSDPRLKRPSGSSCSACARGRRRVRVTTDSAHAHPVMGNHLARRFRVRQLNRVWAADITALPTTAGWCYLAVVLDLASRRVEGWASASTLETGLVLAALRRAIATRPVRPGLLHHSDRGNQYASAAYQQVLAAHGIRPSMSRVGDCWDNAPVESFFSGLKAEATPPEGWGSETRAAALVAAHIDFYNRTRLHSAIGYRSTIDFEASRRVSL